MSRQQIASAFGRVVFIRVTRHGQRTDTEVCAIALQALEDCAAFAWARAIVMTAAADLSPEKRATFLERLAGHVERGGWRLSDHDLDHALKLSLRGLVQNSAA